MEKDGVTHFRQQRGREVQVGCGQRVSLAQSGGVGNGTDICGHLSVPGTGLGSEANSDKTAKVLLLLKWCGDTG